jgi:hypothetical protein
LHELAAVCTIAHLDRHPVAGNRQLAVEFEIAQPKPDPIRHLSVAKMAIGEITGSKIAERIFRKLPAA